MRLGLGHAAQLDEAALGAAHQPHLRQLFLHPLILLPQKQEAVVAGGGHVDGLQKEGVGEGLCDQQNTFFAQRGQKLLGGCGLGQKYHTGIRFLHGVGAQLVAELIRQRRVDHNELKVGFQHPPPRLRRTWYDDRPRIAQLRQACGDIFVGACARAYDQGTSHSAHSFPMSFCIRWH